MGLFFAGTTVIQGGLKICKDTPTLPATTSDIAAAAVYAFPDQQLGIPQAFTNDHFVVAANQSGDSPGVQYPVQFICVPTSTQSFSVKLVNMSGETIPSGTIFMMAFTATGL
jgi:hypothetical protein